MAKRPDGPRHISRGRETLSWDRVRRQMLDTAEVAESVELAIGELRKKDEISAAADLNLTLQLCQLNMLACVVDAAKLLDGQMRDGRTIDQEFLREQFRKLAGGGWSS